MVTSIAFCGMGVFSSKQIRCGGMREYWVLRFNYVVNEC